MRTHGWGPAVVIPAVLGLAACGGGAQGDGVASAGGAGAKAPAAVVSQSLDPKDAQLKFAQCMRENGVDIPGPGPDGGLAIRAKPGQMNQAKIEEAQKACRRFAPGGGVK